MNHITRLLKTFDYHALAELKESLAPSLRYGITAQVGFITVSWVLVDKIFGLDQAAFIALLAIFVTELITGIWAARVRGENISSVKLSRFSLKVACYLVMIGVSYCLYQSFKSHDEGVAGWSFNWLHNLLVAQVVFENTISILENIASINGKEKDAIVTRITNKFNSFFN